MKSETENITRTLDRNLDSVYNQLTGLEDRINAIEHKHDILEMYSRKSSLRIFGVPISKNENTDEVVMKFFANKLNFSLELHDIDKCHRNGRRNQEGAQSIRVKFTSYCTKNNIFINKKNLKGINFIYAKTLY